MTEFGATAYTVAMYSAVEFVWSYYVCPNAPALYLSTVTTLSVLTEHWFQNDHRSSASQTIGGSEARQSQRREIGGQSRTLNQLTATPLGRRFWSAGRDIDGVICTSRGWLVDVSGRDGKLVPFGDSSASEREYRGTADSAAD